MKHRKPAARGLERPFRDLGKLLDGRFLPTFCDTGKPDAPGLSAPVDPTDERRLFQDAMADVTPLPKSKKPLACPPISPPRARGDAEDLEAVERLRELVAGGSGFVVSQTPEYMSGGGPAAAPDIARRLHRGQFAVQAFIDLHGHTAAEAMAAFDRFLEDAVRRGFRTVLVVHGRGLSSPNRPVLKRQVRQRLTSGVWRKWILAYSSARLCDGGAGATYVLLRSRPLTKRQQRGR